MQRRLLAVFAHPDDESFGPGGTLAKYAQKGVEVHILCATKGEAGRGTGEIREKELLEAAKVLGVKKVEFLNFQDGELSNNKYHDLAKKISQKIKEFKPQVILTYDNLGISGHLDHIAVSLATTYVFAKQKIAKRLFYFCRPHYGPYKSVIEDFFKKRYFIYHPNGPGQKEVTTIIDVAGVWRLKTAAMKKHTSQTSDVQKHLLRNLFLPKKEHFIMWGEKKAPKEDLFSGL